ncbi:MAG: putative selenate reductase subunit YgfK [Bacteroidales bacterium]|nr:putative selenate reductase subunit YgfK [Bacteroidales bacterium]
MSDKFTPIPIERLLSLTLAEIHKNRFFGIPSSLFFHPSATDPFKLERYQVELETPVGVAAGPHTQLAINIIAAWLCGARYIELKTIQTLDELEVSKPCIDMQDEGYNCEWSQELKLHESFSEYLNAWIIIHILRKELNFPGGIGTIFNMSVGYNMQGILNENVQWFFQKMLNCSTELEEARQKLRSFYPAIDTIGIPSRISDNITLSTMHGCPPDEIEKIGLYLLTEKKLHTTIKLNPTLLGASELRSILNHQSGFQTDVPDLAFDHDLKYPDALNIIRQLTETARIENLQFGIKLTNTLESLNNRHVFNEKENMMYMSGRALHPISIRLARKLQHDFEGKLDISFSAGVDCFNIADVMACGLKPATVCSDLLKPGGYGRLWQYFENLRTEFREKKAESIADYQVIRAGSTSESAILVNLERYAEEVLTIPAYKKDFHEPDIKTGRSLGYFDCIHAPCVDTCPTHQDIPAYMNQTALGNFTKALEIIRSTNPFPGVTGMVCDHPCQLKCTRINYDEALHIRDIKRFNAEQGISNLSKAPDLLKGKKIAVIGAGPAGLSCAWYLRQAGLEVNIYEQKTVTGGMVSAAIPSFRLTNEVIDNDIKTVLASGVHLHQQYKITKDNFSSIKQAHDLVFISAGAQQSVKLELEGIDNEGVIDPLEFLFSVKEQKSILKGKNVVIIGGGNTAMDSAQTAYRLVGPDGSVTIIYRRTRKEMPADKGEIQAVLEEGIHLMELTHPERIHAPEGKVEGIYCSRNILAMKGKDGRPIPVKVPGSEFLIPCDTIIPAIGQQLDIDFLDSEELRTLPGSYKTKSKGTYIGGDALRGAATAINAIADGRLAAIEMLADLNLHSPAEEISGIEEIDIPQLLHKKAQRGYGIRPAETDLSDRQNFSLVMESYSKKDAMAEASRCLSCDVICNVCVSVCPNLANYSYKIDPVHYHLQKAVVAENGSIELKEDMDFIITQPYQVLNIRDLCNECGNCTTFCPTKGKPYMDKPGLCLSIESLNNESEGYFLSRLPNRDVLIFKHHESIRTLTLIDGLYIYETDQVKASIQPEDFSILEVQFLTPCVKECQFNIAAEMSILMKGALELQS